MLDLNQMALFVQVVQAGSFAEASRRLGMPPTTLSRQVAQLEDALQTRLLQRTTRKLTLTDAGRTLFDQSAAQIEALESAASQLAGEHQAPKGSIRVAASAGFFDFYEIEWVAEFLAAYPGVQLEFVLSDAMADFIGEGIDVAFRGSAELPDSSRAVGQAGPTTWRLNGPDGPSPVAVSGRFSATTGPAQKKAAVGGLGICLLPMVVLQASFRSGELIEVLPGVASSVGNLYVVYPSRRHVPRAVTAFVEMTVQRLAAVIPTPPAGSASKRASLPRASGE